MRPNVLVRILDLLFFYFMAICAIAGLVLAASSCAKRVPSRPLAALNHRVCFGTPMEVYCGTSMTAPDCAAIEGAVMWWNHQVSGATFFKYMGHDNKYEPTLESRYPQNVLVLGMAPSALAKFVPNIDALIALTVYRSHPRTLCLNASAMFFQIAPHDMSYEGAQNTIRHELGHVLGLLDSDDDDGLMIRSGDPNANALKDLDVSELNSLNAMYR